MDLEAAKARGIRVTHTPGVLTEATAALKITFHFVKSSLPLPTKKAFPTGCLPCCWLPQNTGINPGKFSLFNRTQGETFLDKMLSVVLLQNICYSGLRGVLHAASGEACRELRKFD